MLECLTEEQLEDLAASILPEADAKLLKAHLKRCAACQALFGEWQANLAYLENVKRALPGPGRSSHVITINPVYSEASGFFGELATSLAPTDSIPGYMIVREIHRGGQGVVYEAIQAGTEMTVAVKVMLEGPFAGQRSRWRFEREVRLIAALKHPNIVVIHDSGIAQGKYYFAMEYVRGQPIDTHVRLAKLSLRDIVLLFKQVCDAIAHAHRKGVIHRDLKPSNILVNEDGTPRVLDFGLAKIVGGEIPESVRGLASQPGNLMGTIPYMSPEQTTGDHDAIDTRTDVYTLGVILYELLTGRPPYKTSGLDITQALDNVRNADPPRPSKVRKELRSELDAIVLKAMAKEPQRRYQSTESLEEDLTAWLEGRPVSAKSNSSFYVLRKLAARHYFHTSVIATVIVAILSFSFISFQYYLRAKDALDKQVRSDRAALEAVVAKDEFMSDIAPLAHSAVQRTLMGWFLFLWEADRLDEARRMFEQVSTDTPEYEAMAFLLDEQHTLEELRKKLLPDNEALLHFVVGARASKKGLIEEAVRSFELSASCEGDDWLKLAAQGCLQKLRAKMTAAKQGASLSSKE